MTGVHRIDRLTFAMEIADETRAEPLQDRLSRFAARHLDALLDDTLAGSGATMLNIDRLSLDLGEIPEDDLERVLEQRLRDALGLALLQARHDPARQPATGRFPDDTISPARPKVPVIEMAGASLRDLRSYLMRGRYPAAAKPGALDLAHLLRETLADAPRATLSLLAQTRHLPGVATRLSHALGGALQRDLVQAAQAAGDPDLAQMLKGLPSPRTGPGAAPDVRLEASPNAQGAAQSIPQGAGADVALRLSQRLTSTKAGTGHPVEDQDSPQTAAQTARDWATQLNAPDFSPAHELPEKKDALKDQLSSTAFCQHLHKALTRRGIDAVHNLLLPDLAGFSIALLQLAEGTVQERIEQASLAALAQPQGDATAWAISVLGQASHEGEDQILPRMMDLARKSRKRMPDQARFETVLQVLEELEESDIHARPPLTAHRPNLPARPDPLPVSSRDHAREIVIQLQMAQPEQFGILAEQIRLIAASPQGLNHLREALRAQSPDLIKIGIRPGRSVQILTEVFSTPDRAFTQGLESDLTLTRLLIWADQGGPQDLHAREGLASQIAPFLNRLAKVTGLPRSDLARQLAASLRTRLTEEDPDNLLSQLDAFQALTSANTKERVTPTPAPPGQAPLLTTGRDPAPEHETKAAPDSRLPIAAASATPQPGNAPSAPVDPGLDLSELAMILRAAGFPITPKALSDSLGPEALAVGADRSPKDRFARLAAVLEVAQGTLARRLTEVTTPVPTALTSALGLASLPAQGDGPALPEEHATGLSTRNDNPDSLTTPQTRKIDSPMTEPFENRTQDTPISETSGTPAPEDPDQIRFQIIRILTGAGVNMDHAALSRLVREAVQATGRPLPESLPELFDTIAQRLGMARDDLMLRLGSAVPPGTLTPELALLLSSTQAQPASPAPEAAPFHTPMAGLVLVHLHLPTFLERSGCLDGNVLTSPRQADRAVHLISQIATGTTQNAEHDIALPKLLAGLRPEDPVSPGFAATPEEDALADDLLRNVASQVSALQNTTPDVLRDTFLMRHGHIGRAHPDAPLTLHVAKGPFDMLLEGIPWPYSLIRLPWMREALHVEWT